MCQSSLAACERTNNLSGLERAFRAEQVGKATNARLERESAALLKVLQGEVEEIDIHKGTRSTACESDDREQGAMGDNGDEDDNKGYTSTCNDASAMSKRKVSSPDNEITNSARKHLTLLSDEKHHLTM